MDAEEGLAKIAEMTGLSPASIKEQIEQSERHEKEHTFQLGDAPRLPANTREEAAVARWIEVDKRRYKARVLGLPFSYTQAERQLKRRLLKAGLIIVKPLTFRLSQRDKRKIDQAGRLRAAKAAAARGDAGAIQALQEIEHDRKVDAWTKKMRMLRQQEPQVLLDALRDVMAARKIQRPLTALWREFAEGWENASVDKRVALVGEIHEELIRMSAIIERRLAT
jgi:hypothetical protein